MTKYCPNCGKPYEEGVAFCAGCGTSLNGAKPAKASFKSAITKKGLSEVQARVSRYSPSLFWCCL